MIGPTRRDARELDRSSIVNPPPRRSARYAGREGFIAFTISVNDASTRQCVPRHNAAAIGAPDYAD